ncbi:hypothetical protein OHA70_24585 [Kribbella sp. NBC_00382]|uniref:hypothetical protein n=1 Tax=Kribbella sp. NBC_00382 TaxID=2975967 RepID=UPI002E245D4B
MRTTTPLGAIAGGLLAGTAGTLAMDAVLFTRYRRDGGACPFGIWEFNAGLDDWADAPVPAQVGRRLVEGVTQRELPVRRAALVSNITHWSYAALAGVSTAAALRVLSVTRSGWRRGGTAR